MNGCIFVALTAAGAAVAKRAAAGLPGARLHGLRSRVDPAAADYLFDRPGEELRRLFLQRRPLVAVCAAGVVIRALAPLLADKRGEAPVLAVADDGSAVVPLLGGHRGANRLAEQLAERLGGTAAITSAGDRRFKIALDAPPAGWRLANPEHYKPFSAALLAGETVSVSGPADWLDSAELPLVSRDRAERRIEITDRVHPGDPHTLVYHPATLALGVGCERDTNPEELSALVKAALNEHNLASQALACVASIDLKMDEPAVHALAAELDLPLRFFSAAELERLTPRLVNPSATVFRAVGCHGVAEAAALAAAGRSAELTVEKTKSRRATCAVARAPRPIDPRTKGRARGQLSVVGIGPGGPDWRTPQAEAAILAAEDLIGYRLYLDLLGTLTQGKRRHDYRLGEETERVDAAFALAAEGRRVALVCSGDAGIYAMAALVFERLEQNPDRGWEKIAVEIAPGISALQAAAARSGALLGHDFCAISLSDLLTPWAHIERRVRAAAEGDFVIAFYNPVSKRRTRQLDQALEILRRHRPTTTPVVLGRNLGRPGETVTRLRLEQLNAAQVDMLTVVLVGASGSRFTADGRWVYTPRGYATKTAELMRK